jgi:hypothetical protein
MASTVIGEYFGGLSQENYFDFSVIIKNVKQFFGNTDSIVINL